MSIPVHDFELYIIYVKMAKSCMKIHPRLLFEVIIHLISFYINIIIISKLQGSFFCSAYISCPYNYPRYSKCNKGISHDVCESVVASICTIENWTTREFNTTVDLKHNESNQHPANCG